MINGRLLDWQPKFFSSAKYVIIKQNSLFTVVWEIKQIHSRISNSVLFVSPYFRLIWETFRYFKTKLNYFCYIFSLELRLCKLKKTDSITRTVSKFWKKLCRIQTQNLMRCANDFDHIYSYTDDTYILKVMFCNICFRGVSFSIFFL